MTLLSRFAVLSLALTSPLFSQLPATELWPAVKTEAKPWTRWWWLGSAVDKPGLTAQLEEFQRAGLGGVEITPIYGAKGYEERYLPFLSPAYVEMLAHTAAEAKRLGLAVDMATGTGWPFGGKNVSRDDAELRIEIKEGQLAPVSTRFKVKRAAPGGEGWVLNPFSGEAMTHYLEPFSKALELLPIGALHGQFHDSFEYTANWSKEVLPRFETMHGYRLQDYIEVLAGQGDPETTARIKYDYRETLAALHLEYMSTWIAWTHARGQIARNQAHGAPANLLDLYALSDVPETEVFGASNFPIPGYRFDAAELSTNEPQPLVNRLASSAAHVIGRPLTSSETFTWLREHFHEAPSEMKPELDQLFLTGINHVFYHGTAYSPADAPWPGWLFYASTQYNPRNPLWRDLYSLNSYITRAQSLLQAGQPDNDFLLYWPIHDLWQRPEGWNRNFSMHGKDWLTDSETGAIARDLLAGGYSFDFISDSQLLKTDFLQNRLKTPGARYRTLIVPPTKLMPTATLERILALARQGATILVVGDLPTDVPGYAKLSDRRLQLRKLLDPLKWTDGEALHESTVGRGHLYRSDKLAPLLGKTEAKPEPSVSAGLSVLRRSLEGTALYFVANLSGKTIDGWVQFTHSGKAVAALDPRSGTAALASSSPKDGGTSVYLQLQPGESRFLRFLSADPKGLTPLPYVSPAGPMVALAGTWKINFTSGGPKLPEELVTTELRSWTERPGPSQSFAGTATYELEFTAPEAKADDWLLSLGEVRETARVYLNGKQVDHLWSLPFQTRLGKALVPGKNVLRLEVTNTAANRIRQMDTEKAPWKNFHEINFVNIHYQPLDASKWELQPSGLLGPVTLTPLKMITPETAKPAENPGGAVKKP